MPLRVLIPLLVIGFMVYALADASQADQEERGNLPRWLWIILIVFLPLLGSIAWICVSIPARLRRKNSFPHPEDIDIRPAPSPQSSNPAASDDDPELLWLREQARLQDEARRKQKSEDDAAENGSPTD